MIESALVVLLVLLASILQGFTGFGYGLTLMAVLPFLIPITSATILVSFTSVFISIYMILRNRENIDLKLIIYPLIGTILFIPVGVYLLNYLNELVLKILLGLILVIISLYFLLQRDRQLRIKPIVRNGILAGATAGTLNGVLSVGGPPLVLYFIHAARDKLSYKASMDSMFLIGSMYRIALLYLFGNISQQMYPLLSASVLAGILGTIFGFNYLIKVERAVIKSAVYIVMLLAGLTLIVF